jgi:uncharacterized repeat protein (TIGR01451 family)
VDAWVLNSSSGGETTEFLVYLSEQADLSAAAALRSKKEKGEAVYRTLTALAERTQPPLEAILIQLGADYRAYWIANMFWVRGGPQVIQALALRPDVAHIYANPSVQFDAPSLQEQPASLNAVGGVEWNVQRVNADDVWAVGFTGQGVVVGGQDTGYDWEHPALKDKYRGWNGISVSHDYHWHDAIHTGGGLCGPDSLQPCDDYGHGTHTMGIMVGDDGAGNQVGVAPGAKWIGCRNMSVGVGTPATYIECFQWFLAPTRLDGSLPRPDLAPDVINNSWGCPPSEGCDAANIAAMQTAVENVRAAGIVVVVSAGNDGYQGCGSVNDPPAIYGAAFTVGNTDFTDTIASNSSRGPADVTGLPKPDVSAPGTFIRSSIRGGGYGYMSGTSMAAPHVAGEVALLLSAQPGLRGQVDAIEDRIRRTALPRTAPLDCGSVPGANIPNNTYGWGRVDATAALLAHQLVIEKTVTATLINPAGTLTYTLAITHTHLYSATTGVIVTDTLPASTRFISATLPYTLTGNVVKWELASLGTNASHEFQLVVQTPITTSEPIVNRDYGVSSVDVPQAVMGRPLVTWLKKHVLFLPIIQR